jgi:hypothetical protein
MNRVSCSVLLLCCYYNCYVLWVLKIFVYVSVHMCTVYRNLVPELLAALSASHVVPRSQQVDFRLLVIACVII